MTSRLVFIPVQEERKLGQIDAQGNFIAREKARKGEDDEDDEEEEDAWLKSEAGAKPDS